MATKFTNGAQIPVYSKGEVLKLYKDSNYVDCRISAYGYNNNSNSKLQIVDFVMIDLDLSNFNWSLQDLNRSISKILRNLKKVSESFEPSLIWSGNGCHILIPLEPLQCLLENMSEFSRFKEPSKEFLRFIELHLSNGKCDQAHNKTVSFSNCMLRIPGS